jgi:hypothetical protein
MKKSTLLYSSGALALAFAGATLVACGDDTTTPAADAGPDGTGAPDSTTPVDSSAPDTGTKADTGGNADTGSDAGTDSSTDSGSVDAGKDTGSSPDSGTDAGSDADAGNPPPPVLGAQIDRFGRPAINTALNHSFDPDASSAGAAKDKYNADTDGGAWVAEYSPEFQKNLAILDSLDTTADGGPGCGNQPFAQDDAGALRYATLAGVLANDKLWINTAATTCSQYLGVELIATGVLPNDGGVDGGPTNECGGRMLSYDVIQTTYSIVAGVGLSGFGSGVSAVATKTSGTTFPYLAPPQ